MSLLHVSTYLKLQIIPVARNAINDISTHMGIKSI